MSPIVLLIIVLIIQQAYCASVSFDISLASPNLELDCDYKLEKDETLYKVILKKDGHVFVSFDESTKSNPKFAKVEGISDITLQGGGKLTINNFVYSTWGVYSCVVLYDIKRTQKKTKKKSKKEEPGSHSVSKKLRIKSKECRAFWVDASNGEIPEGAPVAAKDKDGKNLIYCRANQDSKIFPGYLYENGCRYVDEDQKIQLKTDAYQVLSGGGLSPQLYKGDNEGVPPNAFAAGTGSAGTVFLCGCQDTSNNLGKCADKLYYIKDDVVTSECAESFIFTCR